MSKPQSSSSSASSIVTISLNPVFDLILEVDDFRVGEHQVGRELQLLAAGKGLNVCRTLNSLGLGSIISGFVGQESMGDFEQALADTAIVGQFFVLPGHTRQNVTIVDPSSGTDTHIRQQGLEVRKQDLERMGKKLGLLADKDKLMVFSGSLPPGISPADLARLLGICRNEGARTVVDTSGEALASVVREGAWLIKPNRAEFAQLTGRDDQSIEQMARAARELTEQVEMILISLGDQGAMLITKDSAMQARLDSTEASTVLNTVGSGDALLGAFLSGVVEGRDMQSCLRGAVAVSWAACQTSGPGDFEAEVAREVQGDVRIRHIEGM